MDSWHKCNLKLLTLMADLNYLISTQKFYFLAEVKLKFKAKYLNRLYRIKSIISKFIKVMIYRHQSQISKHKAFHKAKIKVLWIVFWRQIHQPALIASRSASPKFHGRRGHGPVETHRALLPFKEVFPARRSNFWLTQQILRNLTKGRVPTSLRHRFCHRSRRT